MANAQTRGWGHPDDRGYRANNIVSIVAGGVKLNVRREVAHLFKGFIDDIVARGYDLDDVPDDWGWNNRDIRGLPGVKSNHAWGLAIDLNATKNPMIRGKLVTDMPSWVPQTAARYGLYWGGYYEDRPDPMHFEFLKRPSDVALYPIGPRPVVTPVVKPVPAMPTSMDLVPGGLLVQASLDPQGRGWVEVPINFDQLAGIFEHGPYPVVDGYDWMNKGPLRFRAQPRNGKVIVSVYGGQPGERIAFHVRLRYDARLV